MSLKIIAAVAALSVAGPAIAANAPVAQLQSATGKVLINQGNGFVPANGLVALNAGDKIMVGKDGSASVLYTANGCTVDVAAASVAVVAEKAPCVSGETVGSVDSVFIHSAAGEGAGGAPYVPFVVISGLVTTAALMTFAVIEDEGGSVSRP
jgi:hypothetical protein